MASNPEWGKSVLRMRPSDNREGASAICLENVRGEHVSADYAVLLINGLITSS
jgi:hypothetical protein